MPPKRPSTEIEDAIIKQGCLIKSPPVYLASNKASWKGRLFKLCKTLTESYYIRYYAFDGVTEKYKGEIAVRDVDSIELGSNTKEKILFITRLFNNSPENVLCVRTRDRVYYLVDENEKNIADWQKSITDVWVKINKKENVDGPQIAHTTLFLSPPDSTLPGLPRELRGLAVYPIQNRQPAAQLVPSQEYGSQAVMMDTRPKSYPEDYPSTDLALLDIQDRQRSLTDPEPRRELPPLPRQQLPSKKPSEKLDQPCAPPERKRSQTYSDAIPARHSKIDIRRSSLSDQSRTSADTAYSSDSESIYDTPRSLALSIRDSIDSNEEEDEDTGSDSPDRDVYLPMWSLQQNSFDSEKDVPDSTGQVQSPPDAEDCLCVETQNDSVPHKPPRNSRIPEPNRYPKPQGSQLKKVKLLKMIYEQDSLDYATIHLTVSTAHLQKHLNLQEVGERLCVSKWKGPVEIGCVFCHGDHIKAVNGFRPENKEFFFQMLARSIDDTVNLVVIRNKRAGVFHVEGCNCGGS